MSLPRAPYGDLTLRLARDPYRLIGRVAARLGTDAFRGRLMLQETVFLTGADRARLFYESDLSREGAAPAFVQVTLFVISDNRPVRRRQPCWPLSPAGGRA